MNKLEDQKIFLKDYQVPNYLVDQVKLTFKLSEEKTRVLAKVFFRANPEATDSKFYLDGVDLDFQWARIDGEKINPKISSTGLSFDVNKKEFVWECEVIINPKKIQHLKDSTYQMACTVLNVRLRVFEKSPIIQIDQT